MSWFRKKKEENYTTDYIQGSGDNTIVMRGHYHQGSAVVSGSVYPDWASRYLGNSYHYTPEQVIKMESRVWDNLGYTMVDVLDGIRFPCSYCRTKIDGKELNGVYICPRCGAPLTHYEKGFWDVE